VHFGQVDRAGSSGAHDLSGVNISAPASRLITAISADASSTTYSRLGGLAPFGNQFVDQRDTGLDVFPDSRCARSILRCIVVMRSSSSSMRKITSSQP